MEGGGRDEHVDRGWIRRLKVETMERRVFGGMRLENCQPFLLYCPRFEGRICRSSSPYWRDERFSEFFTGTNSWGGRNSGWAMSCLSGTTSSLGWNLGSSNFVGSSLGASNFASNLCSKRGTGTGSGSGSANGVNVCERTVRSDSPSRARIGSSSSASGLSVLLKFFSPSEKSRPLSPFSLD